MYHGQAYNAINAQRDGKQFKSQAKIDWLPQYIVPENGNTLGHGAPKLDQHTNYRKVPV